MKLRKHRFEVAVGVMIFVVCLLVMLPGLQIAYFGLLDDGGFLVIAKAFRQNLSSILTHESIRGRFRPAFYLYLTFSDLLLGLSPKKYFFLLMILLNTSAGMLFAYLRLKGVHRIAAVFSVLLFVVSAPVFENYYTVFKNEPIMLIWVLVALLLGRIVLLRKRNWERILLYVGVVFSTFMAMASKETAAIMPAIYLGWYLISLVKKDQSSPMKERITASFLLQV